MANLLSRYINENINSFRYGRITEEQFVNACNEACASVTGVRLYNRRNRDKVVTRFSKSPTESKVIIRYNDGTSSTMLIRNVLKNIIGLDIDEWEEMDEDAEQEKMWLRMGIRV